MIFTELVYAKPVFKYRAVCHIGVVSVKFYRTKISPEKKK